MGTLAATLVALGGCSESADPYSTSSVEPQAAAPMAQSQTYVDTNPFATPPETPAATAAAPSIMPDHTPSPEPEVERDRDLAVLDGDPDGGGEEPIADAGAEDIGTPDLADPGEQIMVSVDPGVIYFTPPSEQAYERIEVTLASPTGRKLVKNLCRRRVRRGSRERCGRELYVGSQYHGPGSGDDPRGDAKNT